MLIYVIVSCPQVQRAIIDVHIENCIFISVIVFYFVFSAVFIVEGQNLTISFIFGLIYVSWCNNSKLLNTYENINVCAFVFFHTILTVAQSTQMTIIQFYLSANSVYLAIYILCITPGGCCVHSLGEDTLLVHPIEVYPYNCLDLGLKCSGCSYMYQIVPLLLALFVYMYEL